MEYFLVAFLAAFLIFVTYTGLGVRQANRLLPVLLLAFVARLVVHVMVMRPGLIEYGGDNRTYLARAGEIATYWRQAGFRFVTADQIASIHSMEVPCNLFALVVYLCDGPAALGCTAVVATLACLLCIVMYRFAQLIGASEQAAFRLFVVVAFLPALLLHTSDTFKDGINAFLVVTCLWLVVSNVQRFDVRKLILMIPLLWMIWHVRPYMVFMCALPLTVGLSPMRRKLTLRSMIVSTLLLIPLLVLLAGMDGGASLTMLQEQLEVGQSESVRRANAGGGSGVLFEDGGDAWSELAPKLLYTLLAPFPWTSGSMTLQLGKVDTFIWYYLLYSALRGGRRLWVWNRTLLFVLVLFIIPGTIAYATTMANIGLIFRQRMPIMLIVSLLSALAWTTTGPRRFRFTASGRVPDPAPPPGPAAVPGVVR
ncbi:hypothetical protein ACIBCT_26910 [Streptosporangium sp. NPDC050855]|uniref:hypothetical protein n=1 Tax=Streptosporangium sp. NPDC050855 TaxID=3366194 RepID=UPI0037882A70